VTEVTIIKWMEHALKFMEILILKRERFRFSELAKERIVIGIRFVCMFLFLYTAYAKIVDHDRFYKGLTRVHLITAFALFISYAVPVIEIAVSILLLIPQTALAGLYAFIAIMSVFTLYIISAMVWEPHLPCHCGGAIEKLSWGQHLWFNLAFIFIAIIALRLVQSKYIFKKQ
jgi:hypothetical protein